MSFDDLASAASRSFAQASSDGDAERLVAEIAEELLADYPESATSLGIDAGTRVALKSKLQDRSPAGQQAIAQRVARRLEKLTAIDTAALGDAARIDVDVVRTAHEFAQEGFAFPYGDVALLNSNWSYRNAPYVVAQNTGTFLEIPSMLDEQHTVAAGADERDRGDHHRDRADHEQRTPEAPIDDREVVHPRHARTLPATRRGNERRGRVRRSDPRR